MFLFFVLEFYFAGYSADDTTTAGKILSHQSALLSGTEVEVTTATESVVKLT